MVFVKTKSALACLSGTSTSTTTIAATPMTCHQTETELNTATKCEVKMFTTTWRSRMITNRTNVSDRMLLVSPKFIPNMSTP